MKNTKRRLAALVAPLVALSLLATGCGSDTGDGDGDKAAGSDKSVNLGIIPSWTDGLSTAYLWKHVLEEEGYDVEITELSEAAPLYTGLAKGSVDVYPSAWPEVTHASYMDKYGDDLTDLGAYYDNAKLTLAVPAYSKLNSIEDLKGKGGDYDGRIVGIEPGAGLTKAVQENVIPQYELDDEYKLVTSSTTAMLAELKKAVDAEKDLVVTLWRPFWANSTFEVKDLEDPKGALGEPEGLHEMANKEWAEANPEVVEMMGRLKLDDAQYGELEDLVVNKFGAGKEEDAVEAFLDKHPEVLEMVTGTE